MSWKKAEKNRKKYDKSTLASIAASNYELVVKGKVNIPITLQIDFDEKNIEQNKISEKTSVFFETMKTDDCAIHYLENKDSKNVTIMNFASRNSHGGGYKKGARAQEEDLCRVMPALFASLSRVKYPYPSESVLITPNLEIVRDSYKYKLLQPSKIHCVNVVSVAAQNLRFEQFDEKTTRRKLENMYCSVKKYLPDTDTLILGAWGCGAFGNQPTIMAKIMNDVNLEYGGHFKTIVFSVPEGVNTKEFRAGIKTFPSTKD